jgi:hypothetical protein
MAFPYLSPCQKDCGIRKALPHRIIIIICEIHASSAARKFMHNAPEFPSDTRKRHDTAFSCCFFRPPGPRASPCRRPRQSSIWTPTRSLSRASRRAILRLRGKKCAVGGRERGIISSASYEARACGVYTPMPTARALRSLPGPHHDPAHLGALRRRISRRMFDLCETLTPAVQRNSIDEGYLDLGALRLSSARARSSGR